MKDNKDIKEFAKGIIRSEAQAISGLEQFVDDNFAAVANLIYLMKGRVIVTGIGKSAIIGTKIVATLNSTGTPAIFMHGADAIHGDLGIVQRDDILICLSNSGNTPEIKVLIPLVRNLCNTIVAFTGNPNSFLANSADYVISCHVSREACPNNLAPTSSTTSQLVMGDALAMTLLNMRSFSPDDFAKYHPGGALGKKLFTKVGDIISKDLVPKVYADTLLDDVIIEISSKMLGATAVLDKSGDLIGIVTDGDLRRMLHHKSDFRNLTAADIMSKSPKTIDTDELATKAFSMMEQYKITQLLVTDNERYVGMIHIHDILREGVV